MVEPTINELAEPKVSILNGQTPKGGSLPGYGVQEQKLNINEGKHFLWTSNLYASE